MSIKTIEDCLEALVGLVDITDVPFKVQSEDYTILSSIARQVFNGTAFTDRQYNVVKLKLTTSYSDQFASIDNFYIALDTLRMPLRQIDRSHWVKVVEHNGKQCIGIRFPFSKKYIGLMEKLAWKHKKHYSHDKGTHLHHFELNEVTIHDVVKDVKERGTFLIEPQLLEAFEKIAVIVNSPQDYIPGVYNVELKNLLSRTIYYIISDIGDPKDTPLYKFKDRGLQYGLEYFDQPELDNSINVLSPLTQKMIRRTANIVFVNSNTWSLNAVYAGLLELNRFPLLVVLSANDEEILNQLISTHSAVQGFINNSEISVMFRVDNNADSNHPFNKYVKNNGINNKVDKTTKIVYINNTKYPKPVLTSDWNNSTTLYMGSTRNSRVDCVASAKDLVIHYDTDVTPMAKGFNVNIEKL